MSIIAGTAIESALGGYEIERSLRFNRADSTYLNRTASSPTDGKKATMSFWIKKCDLSTDTNESYRSIFYCGTPNVDGLRIAFARYGGYDNQEFNIGQDNGSSAAYFSLRTTQVFRDTSAWYHFVIRYDSTNATADDRVRIYVNGSQVTSFLSRTNPPLNHIPTWEVSGTNLKIGRGRDDVNEYIDMYLTEFNFIDGQSLDPTSFGEFNTNTGVWQPIKYTGSYGSNGYYLNFSDNSNTTSTTLGKDYSGNGNNWTPNNFSVTAGAGNDSMVDVPTSWGTDTGVGGEVRGNYATLNPLDSGYVTLSNGNLDAVLNTSVSPQRVETNGSIAVSSGKWYWETTYTGGSSELCMGVVPFYSTNSIFGLGVGYFALNGTKYVDGANSGYGATYTTGNIIGVALDIDGGTITFYKNNTSQGAITLPTGVSAWKPNFGNGTRSNTQSITVNFGQRPFAYTAPSGFAALCTTNLPDPAIADGSQYMDALLWTGDGSQTRSLTGLAFQPDFTWMKSRSVVQEHQLYDVVRGAGGGKMLCSNLTAQEGQDGSGNSDSQYGYLSSFDSGGFSVDDGSVATTGGWVNYSGRTYVAWNWKAGGTGVSNTVGTITSTVSANTTAGFSIATYSGSGSNGTVGHGLGVAPKMVIVKQRNGSIYSWTVYHASLTSGYVLALESTSAQFSRPTAFNSTAPTLTVFSLGTDLGTNSSSGTYVAYCFAAIPGYSSMGNYLGNGSSDGPFVYTGFRPRYYILKNITSGQSWSVQDTSRSPYNVGSAVLFPNSSNAEATGTDYVDILSNGFKIRHTGASGNNNNSGDTYIYAAFAENPFKYALAR